jgi:Ala-tRNA(Pro) deacylase
MSISPTLEKYLADRGISYDLIPHEPTMSSLKSAQAGHVPSDSVAKGIMLSDGQKYMLAVLPASHHLRLSDLKEELGHELHLASEDEVGEVFRDCEFGAIPPVGSCYGLNVIIDDSLAQKPDLYFEAGDHSTLVHLKGADFAQLDARAQHGSFSERM